VVLYTSPRWHGVQLALASQAQETTDGRDGISAAVDYQQDNLYLAAALDKRIGSPGKEMDVVRLAAQCKLGQFKVGAIINRSERADGSTSAKNGVLLSIAYKADKITLKAQYGEGDEKSQGRRLAGIGADYSLGAKTRVFTYYAAYDDDAGTEASAYGLGLEHAF